MAEITETVTIRRPVDPRIADLVKFAQYLKVDKTQEELVTLAKDFWEIQHGED